MGHGQSADTCAIPLLGPAPLAVAPITRHGGTGEGGTPAQGRAHGAAGPAGGPRHDRSRRDGVNQPKVNRREARGHRTGSAGCWEGLPPCASPSPLGPQSPHIGERRGHEHILQDRVHPTVSMEVEVGENMRRLNYVGSEGDSSL